MGKFFETVYAKACMKSFLMIFNLAFWASGLAIFCAGIWMQVELKKYLELSKDFSENFTYVLVSIGVLILLVGTFACCCTVKGQSSLLYLYGGFLAIILILELVMAVSVYAYKDRLAADFDQSLNRSMEEYGPNKVHSYDIDVMQKTFHCCGVKGPNDWSEKPKPDPIPRSCCIMPNCDVQDETQVYPSGCYDKVMAFLNTNMSVIGGIALGIIIFPLFGTILACSLAANINKTRYEPMA
ncbi:tetraspanin-7-like [Culicoides brevitarsis]|uniref:tetraspanin-7-like n=1 Tax=Culicoides brevitarsis TaxID=469753 RepID=UPI00307CA07D